MDQGLERLLAADQYTVAAVDKEPLMISGLDRLTEEHRARCQPYARILSAWRSPGTHGQVVGEGLAEVPYLPASLFKSLELRSVPAGEIFKVMSSSGTSACICHIQESWAVKARALPAP